MNIFFVSLGCDKNLVDSEYMLGMIRDAGYTIIDDETQADVIVINTCCFINDAKEESINTILEMAEYKKTGHAKALIVTGCLAQRYRSEIEEEIPEVDAILGTNSYDNIVSAVKEVMAGKHYTNLNSLEGLPTLHTKRCVTTGGHYAHLKIAEGCNKRCTYCIIPYIRGNYRSIPIEELVATARELVEGGVKELILVAQETTLYGIDLYGKKSLHRLLDELNKIPGLYWIRILYCYPEEIDDELIEAIKRNDKVCHYLDIPIQHANSDVLKRMGRKTNKDDLVRIIHHLRKEIPDITLRTTLICGFPGETEEQHKELLEFVQKMKFDRLGAFTYSPEEGTPACTMPDQVDEDVKNQRLDDLMMAQQAISAEINESRVGSVVEALIDGEEDGAYIARSALEAPESDGVIRIAADKKLTPGEYVRVRITGADAYDLMGVIEE